MTERLSGHLLMRMQFQKYKNILKMLFKRWNSFIWWSKGRRVRGTFHSTDCNGLANDTMLCMNEETFGPVAPVAKFKTVDEVIERANNTPYGLAAYIFTKDISQAFQISEALEYGIIGLNDGLPSVAQAPFGGFKESGIGREGGHFGIEEYLEIKYISLGL